MPTNSFIPADLDKKDLHQLIIGSISPRPIALVSTQSKTGKDNLAPYSFFNAVSSNPPVLMFSISTAAKPRPVKDTLKNLKENPECVINIVSSNIARQMSLCSVAFDHGISEFSKSGLTPLASDLVKPKRVEESPVQFECTVKNILDFGSHPGSANVVFCDVKMIHINSDIMFNNRLRIDPWNLEAVGRLGRSYYVHVGEDNIFEMYQPVVPPCIGFDGLPKSVRTSTVLSGQDLAELASVIQAPSKEEVLGFASRENIDSNNSDLFYHEHAKGYLKNEAKHDALLCVLIPEYLKSEDGQDTSKES